MHRIFFSIAPAIVFVSTLGISGTGHALTNGETSCQTTIGRESARFAERKHEAILRCNNDTAQGRTCNTAQRDAAIARGMSALSRQLSLHCKNVTLENLGYPGACTDPDGGSFSVDNLTACIQDAVMSRVDAALMVEYPNLQTLSDGPARCQSEIGSEGETFISRDLRARSRCLDLQIKGRLAPSVDCRASVPPGTGDSKTDRQIQQAITRLADQLRRACADTTLEPLGFPASCPDADGGAFSLENLQSCILETHEAQADAIVAFAYPIIGGGTPTPVATITATPVVPPTPEETSTITPAATATTTPAQTATTTPVATLTAGPTATATVTALPTVTTTTAPTITATTTAGPTATRTATPTATLTPIATATTTAAPTITATTTIGPTATLTAGPTATRTTTPLATATTTAALTPTGTATATATRTATPTATVTAVPTLTATVTAGPTATRTSTPVATPTATQTATATRTATPTSTVTATTTATRTATPASTATRTATPVPTVTSTPSLCGNGAIDPGEDCDITGGAATSCTVVSNTGPGITCSATCQCACPTFVEFVGTSGTFGVLDTGWTGQGHDATVVDEGKVTVAVTSCAGTSRPCGVCNLLGPVDNLAADAGDINSQRCTGNTRTKCNANGDCASAGGTCEYFFGSPLPLAAGGVATCVTNQITGLITGTANVETGAASTTANLISRVYSGPTSSGPCPKCVGDATSNDNVRGGTCDSGQNLGLSCDINGTSPNLFWSSTSLDCPPATGGVLATLPIDLTNSTGTRTRTLVAGAGTTASPPCRAIGFTTLKCFCDTCNNINANPCGANADCPNSGRCVGGANAGKPCLSASECPTGACNGRPCTLGTQCASGTCTGGFCSTLAGLCGGTAGTRCSGGTNNGAPCSSTSQCPGGGACNVPGTATAPNQCDDDGDTIVNDCLATTTCVGGGNAGADCTAASECPGGSCAAGNEGTCAFGPFEQFCGPNATFQGCTANDPDCRPYNECVGGGNDGATCVDNSECPGGTCNSLVGGPPELCNIGKYRNCFTDNGAAGNSVLATGVADVPTNDQSDPTLAALFCIGPTSSSAVNGAAGLPGLGRLELPGHAVGLP